MMRWSISKKLDGVITDDPKRFLEVCDDWEQGRRKVDITWSQWMGILWINFMVLIFGAIFWWKSGVTQKRKVNRVREEMAFSGKQGREDH